MYKVHQENGYRDSTYSTAHDGAFASSSSPLVQACFHTLLTCQQSSGNLPAIMISGHMSLPATSPNSLVLGFSRTPACSFTPPGPTHPFLAFSCHLMLLPPKSAPLPGLKSSITGSLNISLFPGPLVPGT